MRVSWRVGPLLPHARVRRNPQYPRRGADDGKPGIFEGENMESKVYPRSMKEAQELGYVYVGGDCFMDNCLFISENEMEWEGEMEFDLCGDDDHSDGNLGGIKKKAKVRFTFSD
jgi:hypothetical protein